MNAKKNLFLRLLNLLHVPHTDEYAGRLAEEHPFRNSLWALSKLLDKYQIPHNSFRIADKALLGQLTVPFVAEVSHDLAVVTEVGQETVVFETLQTTERIPEEEFCRRWSGVVMEARPDAGSCEPDYPAHRRAALQKRLRYASLAVCLLVLLCLAAKRCMTAPQWPALTLSSILCLAGGALSFLLLKKHLRLHSDVADRLCSVFREAKCNEIAQYHSIKVLGRYDLSECGLAYFATFLLTLPAFPSQAALLLPWVAALALPFTVWSVAYQRIKLRGWCPLCLMVMAVLWMQFLIFLLFGLYTLPPQLARLLPPALFFLCGLVPLLEGCHGMVALQKREAEHGRLRAAYHGMKFDSRTSHILLHAEPQLPNGDEASSLLFGEREEDRPRITVFGNPYCNPCARMHRRIEPLLSDGFEVQYILTSFSPELAAANRQIIAAYLRIGPEKTWKRLTEWYEKDRFTGKPFYEAPNATDSGRVEAEMRRHAEWREQTGLHATPAVLVDGHPLPRCYEVEDLPYLF